MLTYIFQLCYLLIILVKLVSIEPLKIKFKKTKKKKLMSIINPQYSLFLEYIYCEVYRATLLTESMNFIFLNATQLLNKYIFSMCLR
jgi:hypothetical protein